MAQCACAGGVASSGEAAAGATGSGGGLVSGSGGGNAGGSAGSFNSGGAGAAAGGQGGMGSAVGGQGGMESAAGGQGGTTGGAGGQGGMGGAAALPQSVALGAEHSCARLDDGSVKCWGGNAIGQLGSGTVSPLSLTPQTVSGITDATGLTSGAYHNCVWQLTGPPRCWGANNNGELGNGSFTNSAVPISVENYFGPAMNVSCGDGHTCAVSSVGGWAYCWGLNDIGQLGVGPTGPMPTPFSVNGLLDFAIATAAGNGHSCALLQNGWVRCWGANGDGQLGIGYNSYNDTLQQVVYGFADIVVQLAASEHSCARLIDGTVACWGANASGQLGNGTTLGSNMPVAVPALTNVVDIAIGTAHSCALDSGGVVRCWGSNAFGELGNGSNVDSQVPTVVAGLSNVIDIASGKHHSCALTQSSGVYCWGRNTHGQLGDGTTLDSTAPVAVGGL